MTSTIPTISAVLFDADGVVQRTNSGWIEKVRGLCGNPENVEEFLQDVFTAEAPCLIGKGDFDQVLSSVLNKWRSHVPLSEALNVWKMVDPDPGVLGLVRAIRSNGTQVALATNQQSYRAEYMLNDLGYGEEFDQFLCSCFMGCKKPSAEYFWESATILDLPAEHMLFIDDQKQNVEGAKAAGLHSERFHLDDGLDSLERIFRRYGLETQ